VDDHKALVVENDPAMQRYLLTYMSDRGCRTVVVPSMSDALDQVARDSFSVTVIDLEHESTLVSKFVSGLKLQGGDPGAVIALTSGQPWASAAAGVDLFVGKSSIDADLDRALQSALGAQTAAPRVRANDVLTAPTAREISTQTAREMSLWRSKRMQEIRSIIEEAAGVDVTVLITGETGTGKDVVARAIHSLSSRRLGPYVKVNCAAVPRELLESELFGHERGAFTGAHKLKIGKFEAAHNGTIFLDEIGDLHRGLQAKLLHVLQDGEFSRVGGKSTLRVDCRVLAATNQDLERGVAEGRFREDLYYRLNVIQVVVPPLRERMAEVPALIDYFVEMYSKMFRRQADTVPPAILERLMRHHYPGNVRELENLIKRLIVLGDPFLRNGSDGGGTTLRTPVPSVVPDISLREASRKASLAAEREIIARILEETGGNRVRAAKALRISYRALLYKIKRVGLGRARTFFSPTAGRRPEPQEPWTS
jgi:two-component system, NtrC family, response regulator AtoC